LLTVGMPLRPSSLRLTLHAAPRPGRAPCHFVPCRFKEAAKECSNALDIAPNSAKALQRRARSLEQQGLYKQALSDIQAVNRRV
jgi:tetratricopeptide (TPR) repeat protein